jgi:predicted MFS family arabinose efflux permease
VGVLGDLVMKKPREIGDDFPVQNAEVIDASRRYLEAQTTALIAKVILVSALVTIVGASLYGLLTEDFSALQTLWAAIAFPLGAVINHYLERRMRREQEND